jgi:hypothetical protein
VLENQCHYSVNWPTAYACPTSASGKSWGLIKVLVFIFVVYTVAGCAFNVVKYGARVGLEAMPHSEFWRDVPNLVREGITFSVNKVGAWCAVCVGFQQHFPFFFFRIRENACDANVGVAGSRAARKEACRVHDHPQHCNCFFVLKRVLHRYQQSTDSGDYEWG